MCSTSESSQLGLFAAILQGQNSAVHRVAGPKYTETGLVSLAWWVLVSSRTPTIAQLLSS